MGFMMRIVDAHVPDLAEALAVVDKLRQDMLDGKVVAFSCVGIGPDDETIAYVTAARPTSRLKLLGAMAHFSHLYHEGEE